MYFPVTLTLTIYILPLAVTRIVGSVPEEIGRCYIDVIREDPEDCHHYIQCSAGKLYRYYCGHESVFDPFTRTCVAPITAMGVSCKRGKYSGLRMKPTMKDGRPGQLPEEENEIRLNGGETDSSRMHPETGNENDENAQNPGPEKQRAVLGVSDENEVQCVQDGYFGDKKDCRKFYRCFSGSIHVFACPEGMAFDDESAACDFPPFGAECFHGVPKRERLYQLKGRRKIGARKKVNNDLNSRIANHALNSKTASDSQKENHAPNGAEHETEEHQKVEYQRGQFHLADIRRVPNGHRPHPQMSGPRQKPMELESTRPKSHDALADKFMARFAQKFDTGRNDWKVATSEFNLPYQIPAPEQPTESNPQYVPLGMPTDSPAAGQGMSNRNENSPNSDEDSNIYKYRDSNIYRYHDSIADDSKMSPKNKKEKTPKNLNSKQGPDQVESPELFKEGTSPKKDRPAENGQASNTRLSELDSSQQLKDKKDKMNFSYLGSLFYTEKFPCRRNGYYRDHEDCTRFYQCSNTMAYHLQCNNGLVFNIRDGICDWPHKVPECHGRSRSFDRHVAYLQSLTGETIDKDKSDPVYKESNSFSRAEEYICIPGAKRPDPTNCEAFFSCTDGRSEFHFKCPEAMAFHAGDRECVPSELVEGCGKTRVDTSNSSEAQPTGQSAAASVLTEPSPQGFASGQIFRCPSPKGLFRDPSDCSLYYACTDGRPSILSCPNGFVFNQNRNLCDLPTNVPVCMSRMMLENRVDGQGQRYGETEGGNHRGHDEEPRCISDGVFPHSRDCAVFIECHRGTKSELRCSPGLAFHEGKKACVPMDYVARCFARDSQNVDRSRHLENGDNMGHMEGLGETDDRVAEQNSQQAGGGMFGGNIYNN